MLTWSSAQKQIESLALSNQLLPFLGAAVSYFQPTNLPLGAGLLHSALQGLFPNRNLFINDRSKWTSDEKAIDAHSPEVILQGLAEGLLDRGQLASLYNAMNGIPHNPLHKILATALLGGKIPAIFTTNQDHCLEDIVGNQLPIIYDKQDFKYNLQRGIYQFHGAIGGTTSQEVAKRRQSLSFTLHAMGPHLTTEHDVLTEAISNYTLLFLGYSGSDPDIWYSLAEILQNKPKVRIYWCIRDSQPSRHLERLSERFQDSIQIFQGDICEVLKELALIWKIPDPGLVLAPTPSMQEVRLQTIRTWAKSLTDEERDLAYSWLLVSIGEYERATEELEALLINSKGNRQIHMLAALFAGYTWREMSDHWTARKYLRMALDESKGYDQCRYAQAAHKLGESLSTFESVRFWYFWPNIPRIHAGARWLNEAIYQYERISPDERVLKQLGRAGPGNALMNLGQLYRRTASYTPFLRSGMARKAREMITQSIEILETKEKDLRALPMAIAAVTADDPNRTLDEKCKAIDLTIEYSEQWNQDAIQIGSAYFIKAQLLAKIDPQESQICYIKALYSFERAKMKAEIARTGLELAAISSRLAVRTTRQTQGSAEWKLGSLVLGWLKIFYLFSAEVIKFLFRM